MRHFKFLPQSGFSYLWTLFMVASIGLGLAIATDIYTTSVQRDREKELLVIGRQFRTAIGQYYESKQNVAGAVDRKEYPKSIEDLLLDGRSLAVRRYLRKVFVDPMTGKAEWGEIRLAGRLVGVHSLSNQMPIKQAFFEADEIQFNGKSRYSDWVFTYPSDLLINISNDAKKVSPSETNLEINKQELSKIQDEK
ncbi:MAG: hypothetical protein PHR94_16330 [Methylomonas lenta]|nr:hypothetical protein [Methylomonas lenta]